MPNWSLSSAQYFDHLVIDGKGGVAETHSADTATAPWFCGNTIGDLPWFKIIVEETSVENRKQKHVLKRCFKLRYI